MRRLPCSAAGEALGDGSEPFEVAELGISDFASKRAPDGAIDLAGDPTLFPHRGGPKEDARLSVRNR